MSCLCTNRTDIVCNETHCDIAAPGRPGDPDQCRVCWLRLGKPGTIQICSSADGLGDALMLTTACAGVKRDNPATNIVYTLLGTAKSGAPWQQQWVRLFDGYDEVRLSPLPNVPTFWPHETYAEQNRTRLAKPRWQHYADACNTTALLPQLRPLPDEVVQWAEAYRGCIVLSPFSAWKCRAWLPSHWLTLATLLKKDGRRVVVLDGKTEDKDRTAMFDMADVLRDETAERVAAVMLAAACYVGQDSGMSHLAGMLNVPSVVMSTHIKGEKVFGLYPSVEVLDGPLPCGGCHWHGKDWHAACEHLCANLQLIQPDTVFNMVKDKTARTLLSADRLAVLAETARRCSKLQGDFAEFGVFRGGSARVIAQAAPQKTVHLFDTFTGIPEDDHHGLHRRGDFATNFEEVQRYLSGCDVVFHKGFFPDTTKGLEDKCFAFIHCDADLWSSTKAAIEFFWPRLVEGGCICFDDYKWFKCEGVEKAIRELLPNETVEETAYIQCRICKPIKLNTAKATKKGCGCTGPKRQL